MADYNINLNYSKMPKQAFQARQKAIQAQKSIDKEAATGIDKTGKSVDILKHMSKQLDQMIFVLKSISSGQGGGGYGGNEYTGFGGGGGATNRGRSFGRIISGAGALGIAGYAIHKINEIGNAYIERAGAQAGNVGLGGFRFGYGMYNSAEIGAGMKSYAMGTGRFSTEYTPWRWNKKRGAYDILDVGAQSAMNVGAVYGLSAEETLGMYGGFRRAGANYSATVNQALGMGVQSDLPLLLKGMEDIFTSAMREGIDTSEMGKNLGKNLTALALNTPGGRIDTALNIARKGAALKAGLARGEMGTLEGMYGAQATRSVLMKRLTGTERTKYIQSLFERGDITGAQMDALYNLSPNATYQDLLQKGGSSLANYLFKRTAAEMNPAQLQQESMRMVQKQYGTGARAKQRWVDMQSAGVTMGIGEIDAMWKTAAGIETGDMRAKGKSILGKKAGEVEASAAGLSVKQIQMRESMLFKYGQTFATASLKMEQSLLSIAEVAAPGAVIALKGLMKAASGVSGVFMDLKAKWKESNKKGGFFYNLEELFDNY